MAVAQVLYGLRLEYSPPVLVGYHAEIDQSQIRKLGKITIFIFRLNETGHFTAPRQPTDLHSISQPRFIVFPKTSFYAMADLLQRPTAGPG